MRTPFLLTIPAFLLAACSSQSAQVPSASNDEAALTEIEFTMNLPAGWEQQEDEAAEFAAQKIDEDVYVTVLSEPKADFEFDVAQYAEQVIQLLLDNTGGEILSGPTQVTVDGHKALRYEVRGKADDNDLIYVNTVIDGNDDYHQLATFTYADQYDTHKADMAAAVAAFTLE